MSELSEPNRRHVVVIGGGITGLAAAHRLVELDPIRQITLLEAADRLGGVLETVRQDGFTLERSADNFITNVPWALDLCRRLGMQEDLMPTNAAFRQAFVVCRGRLEKIPQGFMIMAPSRIGPMLTTPILGWLGKLRMVGEYFVPSRDAGAQEDESLAAFAIRRFGRQTYERLIQPLVGGIYTADPRQLSVRATLPRFLEMERQHGSLIRAALSEALTKKPGESAGSGARYTMFVTVRGGLCELATRIVDRLPEGTVQLSSPVEKMTRDTAGTWRLNIGGDRRREVSAGTVIVATPAHRATHLLRDVDGQLSDDLASIPHAGCVVVSLGYRREQIGHPLDGFGFVVPAIEKRQILSGSFSSVKYPGRAPDGHELIRVFIGGACQEELVSLGDDRLRSIAVGELADLLTITGEPIFCNIARWPGVMPQYHVGHIALVERIEARAAALGGLHLAGNAYRGVGIPNCIHSGEQAAEQICGTK
jgi:oxygen-dependent protoporphyrinogen oxidase